MASEGTGPTGTRSYRPAKASKGGLDDEALRRAYTLISLKRLYAIMFNSYALKYLY